VRTIDGRIRYFPVLVCSAGRLRLMEKYIGHRLVARPESDYTFCTDSTSNLIRTRPFTSDQLLELVNSAPVT